MMQTMLLILLMSCAFEVAAEDTILKLYRPFGEEGNEPVISKQLQGQCNTQSHLVLREDAWRCQADGATYDPCFVKIGTKQTSLLCPSSPWSTGNIQVNVNEPLNNAEHQLLDMSRTFPWAIELANGTRCQAVEPTAFYDSMPIRYQCTNKSILFGTIQRCNPVWSVMEKDSNGVVTRDLRKAWF